MGSGLLRAAHVREDPPPWVFEDALAGQLLDAAEAAELEAEMAAWPPVVRRALRVSHAVRVRLAEDVAAARQRPVRGRGPVGDREIWSRHPTSIAAVRGAPAAGVRRAGRPI